MRGLSLASAVILSEESIFAGKSYCLWETLPKRSTRTVIEVENLIGEEIQTFISSLCNEEEEVPIVMPHLSKAKFITVARVDKQLAGISGITEGYLFVLSRFLRCINVAVLFIGVKPQFRGRGVGNAILQEVITFTKERYSCLMLTTYKSEEYRPAVNLYLKKGFIISYSPGIQYSMYLPCQRREIVCRFLLPLSFHYLRAVHFLYRLSSHLFQFLTKKFSSGRHKG